MGQSWESGRRGVVVGGVPRWWWSELWQLHPDCSKTLLLLQVITCANIHHFTSSTHSETHAHTLPLHPWSGAGGRLIMWCVRRMWDGSDTTVCSRFTRLCLSICLCGKSSQLLGHCRGKIPMSWWGPCCTLDYQPSHMFVYSIHL